MRTYSLIGTMSGTSLDGLDMALCHFEQHNEQWCFEIASAETVPYTPAWRRRLQEAATLPALEFCRLHNEYGHYIGQQVKRFLSKRLTGVNAIASHGHTVFHQPAQQLTVQIGSAAEIAAVTRITTINDFRALDVALGGQGAPLVPVGDELLFADFDFCLNIGGFSNISYHENGKRIAYDISPANIICNAITQKTGQHYDNQGKIGRKGSICPQLLKHLNQLPFYSVAPPKSLGREWLEQVFIPVVEKHQLSTADTLRTLYEHISLQIARSTAVKPSGRLLVTGGGAYNTFLLELLKQKTRAQIILPEKELIDFKEALVFAFLGVLRLEQRINCLTNVTGAGRSSCSGSVVQGHI